MHGIVYGMDRIRKGTRLGWSECWQFVGIQIWKEKEKDTFKFQYWEEKTLWHETEKEF